MYYLTLNTKFLSKNIVSTCLAHISLKWLEIIYRNRGKCVRTYSITNSFRIWKTRLKTQIILETSPQTLFHLGSNPTHKSAKSHNREQISQSSSPFKSRKTKNSKASTFLKKILKIFLTASYNFDYFNLLPRLK